MKAQLFAAILIACLCYACNLNNASDKTSEITLMQKEEDQSGNDKTAADTVGNQGSSIVEKNKNTPPQNIDWDKKIIRTANLSIEVKDYKTYSSNLNSLAKKFGGYIANEQETKNIERIENKAKIKVPVAQFQALMTAINSSGEKIIDKQVSSDDVTTEVIDTKSRIEAKKKIRLRYLDFLQQAKTMADILSIQQEVNEVQEQIEMAEGRVHYLTHSAAYSTIDLYYYQILDASAINSEPTFSNKILQAFDGGWEVLKGLLIMVVTIWPLWIIIIAGFIFYRKRKVALITKRTTTV